jgi:hypothetical protein
VSSYTNFSQFVGYYIPGTDFVAKLTKTWSTAQPIEGSTLVILTQPALRRTLGIAHTPARVTLKAVSSENGMVDDPRVAGLLALNSITAEAHVAKFDAQAAQAKQDKANRVIVAGIYANLKALGIDL